jgi:hypothetical protein
LESNDPGVGRGERDGECIVKNCQEACRASPPVPKIVTTMADTPGASEQSLRQMVRARLQSGDLFPIDGRGFAGKGTVQSCQVCGLFVLPSEHELEVVEPKRAFAHLTCHTVWLQESNVFRDSRG